MKTPPAFDKAAAPALLIIGVALRLRQYLMGRSLWADEAMLALNIVNRNFAGLLQPLDYNQGAPLGFLLIEKFFNAILGRHELVLRLFPFLAGIVSLWLFYLLIKQITQNAGLFIALTLFAVNPQLIYYSSESKQYIVDVAVALALLILALPVLQHQARQRDYMLLGMAGIFALWLSHPALFVSAGIGAALIIQRLQKRDAVNVKSTIVMGVAWLMNFILLYFINLRQLSGNSFLTGYWAGAFMPMPPNLNWFAAYVSESLRLQFGMEGAPWLAAILILIGWFALYRETRPLALTFAFITLFAFAASALQLYPIKGRLALFMIPIGIILLGKALELTQKTFAAAESLTHFLEGRRKTQKDADLFNHSAEKFSVSQRSSASISESARLSIAPGRFANAIIALALGGYLIYSPFVASAKNFISPKYFEHLRPYMDYLSASWKDGDALFVSYWAEPAFKYYAPFYKLENIRYESSKYEDYPDPQKLAARFDPLIGKKRAWVLFSHVYENENFNERDFVVAYLDQIGEQRRELRIPDTSVFLFLYDLNK